MEKIYSLNKILDKLSNCNFLAFVSTPWHTYGTKCIIEELRKKKICLKGYIVLLPTVPESEQYYVDLRLFDFFDLENLKIVKCSLEKRYRNFCVVLIKQLNYCVKEECKGTFFYVINPGIPSYDTAREIEKRYKKVVYNIVIDEGLSTYMGLEDGFSILRVDTYIEFLKKNIRVLLAFLIKKRKKNLCYFTLFTGKLESLYLNESTILKYKKILSINTNEIVKKNSFRNTVIVLTQPFIEVGELSGCIDYIILERLVEYLHRVYEYEIVIKTHPKETNKFKYSGLNCKIENSSMLSFEELMAHSIEKPIAVIGFTSTALVTASIFWNIPAYSLCNFLKGDDVSIKLRRIKNKFLIGFKNYVRIVKDLEEIRFE